MEDEEDDWLGYEECLLDETDDIEMILTEMLSMRQLQVQVGYSNAYYCFTIITDVASDMTAAVEVLHEVEAGINCDDESSSKSLLFLSLFINNYN